jgi:hypothetical protein
MRIIGAWDAAEGGGTRLVDHVSLPAGEVAEVLVKHMEAIQRHATWSMFGGTLSRGLRTYQVVPTPEDLAPPSALPQATSLPPEVDLDAVRYQLDAYTDALRDWARSRDIRAWQALVKAGTALVADIQAFNAAQPGPLLERDGTVISADAQTCKKGSMIADNPTQAEYNAYVASLVPGDRVVETSVWNMRTGKFGTVYINDRGDVCVMWDGPERMGTSITWGTRKVSDTPYTDSPK